MGGYNSLPVQSGRNPYLDEIDQAANNAHAQLSPGAQMALKKAGAPVGMTDTAGPQALPAGALKPPAQPIPTVGQPAGRSEFYGKNTFDEKMPNGQDAMMAGTGIHMPTPSAPRQPIQPVPATPASAPAQAELQRLTVGPQATAGVNQIHNPWARVPLQILSAVGETFAPRLAAALPGTESHHQMLVGNAENAVKQQAGIREGEEKAQRNAADLNHIGAETDELIPAQVGHLNAQTEALQHPQGKEGEAAHTITTDQGIMQWNPETKRYDIRAGGSIEKAPAAGSVHTLADGTMIIAHPDGSATPITVNGQPAKARVAETGESTDVKNYNFAKEQGYKGTFEQWQKDEANRKAVRPPSESGTGTWSLQEDRNGTPVLMNSKTGEMKPAPEGLQPRGTNAKNAPERDAITFAENYLKGGKFTASGDEGLMDQFFALAKPRRMSVQQTEMLKKGQSMIQGIRATASHLFTPDAPYFDKTQRENIVETMRNLASSQGAATRGGGGQGGAIPEVKSQAEFDALPKGAQYMEDGKRYQKPQ